MTRVRVLWSRAIDLLLHRSRDERLSEEIQAHLDLLTEEYLSKGMTPDDARLAARRAFGGTEQMKERYRDQRGLPFLDAIGQDVRFAARLLRREPGFAATTVAVLGLGIGINNMLFTILNAHTLRGLPIPEVERVVYITTFDERTPNLGVSFLDFTDWRAGTHAFARLAAFTSEPVTLSADNFAPDSLRGTFVSATAFGLVGAQPMLGRDFSAADDAPGASPAVILGSDAWESRYGRDPAILGRTVSVNGVQAAIVGVMPQRSGFPTTAQVWLPLAQLPGVTTQPRDARRLSVIGRIDRESDIARARSEIETVVRRLSSEYPATNKNVRARVVPINEQYFGSPANPAWMAFMAVGILVVLISCANAANLLLARSLRRLREIAIRASLGASRRRIIRQLLIEGAVLASLGGAVGSVLGVAGVRLFRAAIPGDALPYWVDFSPDGRVLAVLVAVSAGTVFVFALLPAIHSSKPDVAVALKAGGRAGTGYRGRRWTTAFLAAEFGLAVVLLAQFVVAARTAAPLLPSDAAINTPDVLTARVTLPAASYDTADRRNAFYENLTARLTDVSALSSVSLTSVLPLLGGTEQRVDIAEAPQSDPDSPRTAWTVAVAPKYFDTLAVRLVRGRDFTAEDGTPGRRVVIVNDRFAQRFFGDRDPIGQRIALAPSGSTQSSAAVWMTISGVSPSIRQRSTPVPDPVVYVPFASAPHASASLLVRSAMDTEALAALLRRELQHVDATLPLNGVRTMSQVIRDAEWVGRLSKQLFLWLTFVAVALSTVGLYAVTSHSVSERMQEIGVRVALGATRWQVVRLVARRVTFQLAIGFAAGILCTKLWASMFSTGRAGVTATDPLSLVGVGAILAIIAVLACFFPARRATRLDPVAAIRHD